jgi:hypothetical protein
MRAPGVMLGQSPIYDLLGLGVGHIYYFLEDVYPNISNRRLLKTPGFMYVDAAYVAVVSLLIAVTDMLPFDPVRECKSSTTPVSRSSTRRRSGRHSELAKGSTCTTSRLAGNRHGPVCPLVQKSLRPARSTCQPTWHYLQQQGAGVQLLCRH